MPEHNRSDGTTQVSEDGSISESFRQGHHDAEKEPDGQCSSWENAEVQILPANRLGIVCFALMCAVFLAALDHSIVAIVLPTIVAHLNGGQSYSWVANSYVLAAGAFGPLYGHLSNIFGRKTLLYSSILVFSLGSALCGAAQNITWLIVCRALQGVGGGGLMQLSMIVISDIVPLRERSRYGGLLGGIYSIASVSGPLIGGALARHASWRWCFWINLPMSGIAMILLFFFLNVPPPANRPILEQFAELDFLGTFSLIIGVVFLLVGLSFGETSWSQPWTVGPLVAGAVLLVIGAVNEAFTKRVAVLPPRLFKTRTTACLLVMAFLSNATFLATVFYLPLFYQVLGSSAVGAGVKMLPYTLVCSTFSGLAGVIASKTGKNRPGIWFGTTLFTIGTGLLITLDYNSSLAEQEAFPLVAAVGMGFLFQVPLVALQAAMPLKDMATATSAFMFLRSLGGAVGLAVGEAIIAIVLPRKLAAIPGAESLGLGDSITELNGSVSQVHLIPDVTLRNAVLHAWARSIAMVWIVCTALAGASLILTLFLREYSVNRRTVSSGDLNARSEVDGTKTADELEMNDCGQ